MAFDIRYMLPFGNQKKKKKNQNLAWANAPLELIHL